MCNNFPNIRITEGNNFSLVLPLRSRTYVATQPIDEDIDPEQLENVVVTFGGVEYPAQRTAQGVLIDLPATLAVGTYNILLTADYLESSIRAAYESAVTIVPWSAQSTAEQYIAGSPIVLRAAYVLSGALTDAELEALKEEYREKIAEAEQAKEDAEAAKREWEQKAADIEGVAQEATSQEILNAVGNIGAISAELESGKDAIVAAIEAQGGEASSEQSLGELAQDITELNVYADGVEFTENAQRPIDFTYTIAQGRNEIKKLSSNRVTSVGENAFSGCRNLQSVEMPNVTSVGQSAFFGCSILQSVEMPNVTSVEVYAFSGCRNLQSVEMPNVTSVEAHAFSGCSILQSVEMPLLFNLSQTFRLCSNLRIVYVPMLVSLGSQSFLNCNKIIDFICGSNFNANTNLVEWNPTEALRADLNTLLTPEDIAAGFTNNLEKLLYNIREHIAANLMEITQGYAITFSAAVKAAILADQPTADAFTNKGWTIA